jgi:diguanylate cyclase (GGDEF)-like protein/PAS domain S-box-containing protein
LVGHVTERAGLLGLDALQALYEHISDGVVFSRPEDGVIVAANPAACAILGMTEEEICARGRDGLIDLDDARWPVALEELQRTGHVAGPARVRRGDGKVIEAHLTVSFFRGADGCTQCCAVFRDGSRNAYNEQRVMELSARLQEMSVLDELTGLSNRKGLVIAGTQLLLLADRRRAEVEALFVDVHGIEQLNGEAGHQAGDAALQAVARALSVAFRKSDVVSRIGGTLFFVLAMELTDDRDAITELIRRYLAAAETVGFVGGRIELAMGWVSRGPGEAASLEALIERSDRVAQTMGATGRPD